MFLLCFGKKGITTELRNIAVLNILMSILGQYLKNFSYQFH